MSAGSSGRSGGFAEQKRRLRARSEHVLRMAAMEDVARRYPRRTVPSALANEGPFWRLVFVPLYRRVPWELKRDAMGKLKMTAQGWPEQPRQFGEPWRPPAPPRDG
jgi:hypothetical protein